MELTNSHHQIALQWYHIVAILFWLEGAGRPCRFCARLLQRLPHRSMLSVQRLVLLSAPTGQLMRVGDAEDRLRAGYGAEVLEIARRMTALASMSTNKLM